MYDPAIGRWHCVDKLAEYHYNATPYNYVMNNPISRVDLWGLADTNYVAPTPIEEVTVTASQPSWLKRTWGKFVSALKSYDEGGRGDSQPAGSVFYGPGGQGPGTTTTEAVYGSSYIGDFLIVAGVYGMDPKYELPNYTKVNKVSQRTQNVTKGLVKTTEVAQNTDAMIKKANTGKGEETTSTGVPVSNVIPGSGTVSDPVVDVVSQWGSPDSAGVWINKDSLSNGNVTYSKKDMNNSSTQKSNKKEFQRAWNNW